jgi:hypothetical protein
MSRFTVLIAIEDDATRNAAVAYMQNNHPEINSIFANSEDAMRNQISRIKSRLHLVIADKDLGAQVLFQISALDLKAPLAILTASPGAETEMRNYWQVFGFHEDEISPVRFFDPRNTGIDEIAMEFRRVISKGQSKGVTVAGLPPQL